MAGPSCRRVVGLAGEVEMAAAAATLSVPAGDSGANEKDGSNRDCLLAISLLLPEWSHLLLMVLMLLLLANSDFGRCWVPKGEIAAPPTGPCHEGRLDASKESSGVGQSLLLLPAPLLLPALMR